ncbi:phosphoribosyltransferase family protein [Herbaspirillum sp. Sphag1AN]|uniref:phosphoribosyltransferase family protein n=1 Tax=unclassified Herbaspirillum TaxID=2624150 RepID=UPI00351C8471
MPLRHATQGLLRLPSWLSQRCLPSSCALCGQTGSAVLCAECRQRYFSSRRRRCVQCGIAMTSNAKQAIEARCGDCLKHKPAFDSTIVVTDYLAPADQLVLALKFGARLALAPAFAEMMADAMQQQHMQAMPVVLMPVPLGRFRLQERGFNQSLEIARPLAGRLDIELVPQLMLRVRDTAPQSTLPVDERHRNMRRAFVVPSTSMNHVRGRHIGVVDDVMTTGETLGEVAATLKHFGARRVTNIVFSRTPSK